MVASFAETGYSGRRLGLLGEKSGFDFAWLQSLEVLSHGRRIRFVLSDPKGLIRTS